MRLVHATLQSVPKCRTHIGVFAPAILQRVPTDIWKLLANVC
jgi:hypothetical protein